MVGGLAMRTHGPSGSHYGPAHIEGSYRITNQVMSPKAAITEKITSSIVIMLRFSVGA